MENSSLINYLPSDVMNNIFARLPVKSLLGFRCVSKHWCDLIASPSLTCLHLRNYNLNHFNEKSLFRLYTIEKTNENSEKLDINVRNIDTFDQPSLLMKFSSSYYPLTCFDGLILMSNHASKELMLLNPSAQKSLQLPSCPLSNNSSNAITYLMTYASKINDHKIVAIQFGCSFASLTLKDCRWKTNETNLDNKLDTNGTGILVTEGVAHWFSKDEELLICFDFEDERFSVVGMPDGYEKLEKTVFSIDYNGSSVGVCRVTSVNLVIWVKGKDGGEKPWTKIFDGTSSWIALDFLKYKSSCMYTWFVEKKGLFYKLVDGELWSYDIRSGQKQNLGRLNQNFSLIGNYKESLLLC